MKRALYICFFCFALLAAALQSCSADVRQYKVKVVAEHPHDTEAYTQGLYYDGGLLYESTGQYGKSSFRVVSIEDGKVLRRLDFSRKYFGEGSCRLDGKIYILTWTNKVAFVYDAESLSYEKSYSYPREGWGICTDGKSLITSDGSSRLYFLDKNFKLQKSVDVTMNGRPLRNLNELEWIDGKIWANVYLTDMIVVIDPLTGKAESRIDCSGLLPKSLRTPDTDVLNGIACDPETGRIWITGKNWPRLYEVRLVPAGK